MSAQGYEDLAWAAAYGHETGGWKPSPVSWAAFDLIVNTIPAQVLDRRRLQWVNPGAFLLDLASAPGVWTGQRPRTGPAGPSGAGAARDGRPLSLRQRPSGILFITFFGNWRRENHGGCTGGICPHRIILYLREGHPGHGGDRKEYPNMVPILSETTGPQTPGLAGGGLPTGGGGNLRPWRGGVGAGGGAHQAQTAAGCAGHRPLHREQFLAKLANGIADTSVTMAAKAHLRNGRPVVLAVSTNDGLAGARNIGNSCAGSITILSPSARMTRWKAHLPWWRYDQR